MIAYQRAKLPQRVNMRLLMSLMAFLVGVIVPVSVKGELASAGASAPLRGPSSLVIQDGNVWVANIGSNSLTELDASTGALELSIPGSRGHFSTPNALASGFGKLFVASGSTSTVSVLSQSTGKTLGPFSSDNGSLVLPISLLVRGPDLWVANASQHGVVSEFDVVTHHLIRVIQASRFMLADCNGIAADKEDVWVTNLGNDTITEFSADTGRLVRVIRGGSLQISAPWELAYAEGKLWISNKSNGGGMVVVNAETGAMITRVVDHNLFGAPYGALAVQGRYIWVTLPQANAVVEIDMMNYKVLRALRGSEYGFNDPSGIAIFHDRVWVSNFLGSTLTAIDANTGKVIEIVR
jgi:DNA-binding beta-propeller fold protein YncE